MWLRKSWRERWRLAKKPFIVKQPLLKLIAYLLTVGLAFSLSGQVNAETSQRVDLLSEPNVSTSQLKQAIVTIDPDAEIEIVPEVGIFRINSKDPEFKVKLRATQSKLIKAMGQLGDMLPESVSLNQVAGYDRAMVPEIMAPGRSAEIELLKELSWHVDRVTNEGQSLAISQGTGVSVGVIDSGADIVHPMLMDHVDLSQAKSYVEGSSGVNDQNGHGTMVSGIIAQTAPQALITPYRVLGPDGGDSLWTIEAIVQSANDQKDVVNLSLGTYKSVDDESEQLTIGAFERAIDFAESKGVILVTSAGNKGLDLDDYLQIERIRHLPGSVSGVLSISATNKSQAIGTYSNFGSHIKYAAPGGDYVLSEGVLDLSEWIYGLHPTGMDNGLSVLGVPQGYNFSVGTSLSAPLVTGIVADVISHHQKMTGRKPSKEELTTILSTGAVDLGIQGLDPFFGDGEINGFASLGLIKDTVPPAADFQSQTVELHSLIKIEDLLINLCDNVDQTFDMVFEAAPVTSQLGSQEVRIRISDQTQNSTVISGQIDVVDRLAPTGKLMENYTTFLGEEIELSDLVVEYDDNAGKEQVKITLETVFKKDQLGRQPVTVRLEDHSGNYLLLESVIEVKQKNNRDVTTTQSSTNKREMTEEKNDIGKNDVATANQTKALALPKTGEVELGWKTVLFGIQIILMCLYLIYDNGIRKKKE